MMRRHAMRVVLSVGILSSCLGVFGCNTGDITGEDIRDIVRTNVGATIVGIGTAILEAAVEAAFE